MTDSDGPLAELVAAALTAHPTVARLHGGQWGEISTYLPGRKLIGVRAGHRIEVGVVLRLAQTPRVPLHSVVRELRALVSAMVDGRPIDITVGDVEYGPALNEERNTLR